MGMALWCFQRTAPGVLERVSMRAHQAFYGGELGLEANADGNVLLVEVSVFMEARQVRAVDTVWFVRERVDEKGRVDAEARRRSTWEAIQSLDGVVRPREPQDNVVEASGTFASRRHSVATRWEPAEEDLAALRTEIERKAGAALRWKRVISERTPAPRRR